MAESATLGSTVKQEKHYIDGRWEAGDGGETFPVVNPATGETIATCVEGTAKDVDAAVAAARRALDGPWGKMDAAERGRILYKLAELIERDAAALARLECLNNGKTISEVMSGDIPPTWDICRYYAGWANKYHGEVIPVDGNRLNYTLREPMGVVGLITPWNYPILIAAWKVAPALAMGNTIVLKPAEQTPLTSLRFAELAREAGVPEGVFNVVTGGARAGAAIASHMDIDKVSFTGSTHVGRLIMKAAAESNLKRVTLELGGKSPNIVFPDADLDAAVDAAFWGIFANKGEVCSAGSRLFLHQEVYDRFLEKLVARAKAMKVGDPLDPDSEMGCQVSVEQMEGVLRYIEKGKAGGATLLCGGARDTEGAKAKGTFIQPTVFGDVTPAMAIAKEEIFGPVLACIKFKDEDEVVAIANGTPYGLVSAVWTRDVYRAHRLARRIKAGTVWINLYNGFDSASPFGGYKQSGFGREMGIHALESYTQVKSVWVAMDDPSRP